MVVLDYDDGSPWSPSQLSLATITVVHGYHHNSPWLLLWRPSICPSMGISKLCIYVYIYLCNVDDYQICAINNLCCKQMMV